MLYFSDSDRIVLPDVLARHSERHQSAGRCALVVGDLFGRRAYSHLPSDLDEAVKRRLLDKLQLSGQFSFAAASLATGKRAPLLSPGCTDIWRAAQPYAVTDRWKAGWGEVLVEYGENLQGYVHGWLAVSTGALSISKVALEQLGGFDEHFFRLEDWEFGIRAQEAGLPIIFAPEAEGMHLFHPAAPDRGLHALRGVRS